ncbi:MAG: penicillin-binding transpeptidase domain-containing protein [Bacteroidetes bacterium]|nr:penicillin-binding transpeptidase domain-containing protein [Bacteroidota bacterium]MDA1333973.1 penicillin-binding transpeptidase domain-containing protein [Bacteroidota bacterium]
MELKDQILARMYVVITLISLLPVLVGLQLLRVSAIDGDDLREIVQVQSTELRTIPALRGEIFDATERPLVVNIERVDIALDPMEKGFSDRETEFYQRLSKKSGTPVSTLRSRVRNRASKQYIMLARDVTMTSEDLRWFSSVPGVLPEGSTTRRYNHGSAAAHVLGVAGIDAGQSGLEFEFNEVLRGTDGQRVMRKDRQNRLKLIPGSGERPPVHGESLYLTIDLVRQSILEEELERGAIEGKASWAAAVALDPNTGEIIAMANWPTYDPNRVGSYPMAARRNHVVEDKIEPGSVIKVVPAVAAVESGAIAMSDSIDTGDGTLQQGRFTIRDMHPNGTISFSEVIMLSSNLGTAIVAEDMSEAMMYQYARQFGFNQKTGIELPGEVDTRLKQTKMWDATTKSAMSRGYAIEASPLQVALAYGALANGGLLMKPYIVRERRNAEGFVTWRAQPDSVRRVFSRETAATLMPAFESVVSEDGTAPLAHVEGLRIAGKTGTARKAGPKGYLPGKYRATFVGFWPVENPQVVLAIVMDEPGKSMYGGIVAAPVFQRVTERWMARMPQLAEYVQMDGEPDEVNEPVLVPDAAGQPVPIARRRMLASGLKMTNAKDDFHTAVLVQDLSAGTETLLGVPVRLTAEPDTVQTMPDLEGLSAREAMAWLKALHVDVVMSGHGTVVRQSPEPGAALGNSARLTLN